MRLHLQRLATGAVILAILLGILWIRINNNELLNMILYLVSFCTISYLIGYFLLKIRMGKWRGKVSLMVKKYFSRARKGQKDELNGSRRAHYRKSRKSQ